MNHYIYYDNKVIWRGGIAFECDAENILEADKLFKEATGKDVVKMPWIGCDFKIITEA